MTLKTTIVLAKDVPAPVRELIEKWHAAAEAHLAFLQTDVARNLPTKDVQLVFDAPVMAAMAVNAPLMRQAGISTMDLMSKVLVILEETLVQFDADAAAEDQRGKPLS